MRFLRVLLSVTTVSAASTSLFQEHSLKVVKGNQLDIISPGYPNVLSTGTKITWNLSGEVGSNLLLTCENVGISSSPECTNGYFMINDGGKERKYCGSETKLKIKSLQHQMKLELDLNGARGFIKCQIKAIKDEYPQFVGNVDSDVIELKPGGPAYGNIYFRSIPANTRLKWRFNTLPPYKIAVFCTIINLAPCDHVADYLVVDDTTKKAKICGSHFNKRIALSAANKLTLELRGGNISRYSLDCLAQAVSGSQPFEYRNIVSQEVNSSEYGLEPGVQKTNCNCGWSVKSPSRIVNGEQVKDGQYPWIVSVNYKGKHICGGSILTEYHVLTAAHCTSTKIAEDFKAFVGTTNNIKAVYGQIVQIAKIIEADYKGDFNVNDMAMLVLKEKIHFTDWIGPVCLTPARLSLDHKYVTVMGWGNLGKEGEWRNSHNLMKANVRVVDFTTCSFLWYRKFNATAQDRLCTWATNKDSCFGDSGGPVVWLDPEINRYTLLGIVSMGRGCNTADPKINAYVPYHYDWIQKTIKETLPGVNTCYKITS